ncbi:hypothetical protein K6U06_16460 [Acidiferrimicrobium sp. IK]|uniref:hypothetical protein n=1 Tax=Acidiferrimicrobium sp. IK TaxID=2871700 RepID=UPI0021CB15D0|nr:hypothetical protein [Acidiferrimicrobium sp. IK]MCU4185964.1 hypothetical protein [Acidiferrimicrobium sp. IK]
MTFLRPPPYRSQFGSLDACVARIRDGSDPAVHVDWAGEGFASADEYRLWSEHSCGASCMQMLLAAAGRPAPPAGQMVAELTAAGAYQRDGDAIVGLVYDPCVAWMRRRWGIEGRTERCLGTADVRRHVAGGAMVVASVAKEIRTPARAPSRRGGHLVLVWDVDDSGLRLHNPSGLPAESADGGVESARGAVVATERFDELFARRAMVFPAPSDRPPPNR